MHLSLVKYYFCDNLQNFTDTMSIGRCRIFYKYGNRNSTYITDEFAEELIKTLPYTPVKGIYEEDDYTDHGTKRNEGRIYGIVPGPQDMNFAWEKHLDEDGVEREYACVNVYYYTALYEEAMGYILDLAVELPVYQRKVLYAYNAKVINSDSLPAEINPYTSPLDKIWEIDFAKMDLQSGITWRLRFWKRWTYYN